jgi:hypothetical protein
MPRAEEPGREYVMDNGAEIMLHLKSVGVSSFPNMQTGKIDQSFNLVHGRYRGEDDKWIWMDVTSWHPTMFDCRIKKEEVDLIGEVGEVT